MNPVDYIGAISAVMGGIMAFSYAYLSGFKDRGFPGLPWLIRGLFLFLGLALWIRAGMIYPAAVLTTAQYPHGHHVTLTEASIYGIFSVLKTSLLAHYFFSAHRWYAEGVDLQVDPNDRPTVKNVPEQIKETLRTEMPGVMAAANSALLDGLGGPVKPHGGKK